MLTTGVESVRNHVANGRAKSASKRKESKLSKRQRLRDKLANQQGWLCYYCKQPMTPVVAPTDPQPPTMVTLEHLQPVSRSGATTAENCVAACHACNSRKGDGPPPRPPVSRGAIPAGGFPIPCPNCGDTIGLNVRLHSLEVECGSCFKTVSPARLKEIAQHTILLVRWLETAREYVTPRGPF